MDFGVLCQYLKLGLWTLLNLESLNSDLELQDYLNRSCLGLGILQRLGFYVFRRNMAAGTDFSPPFTVLEGSYSKDNLLAKEDEISENSENLKQITFGKPPRHLSIVRHCISSDTEATATDMVS